MNLKSNVLPFFLIFTLLNPFAVSPLKSQSLAEVARKQKHKKQKASKKVYTNKDLDKLKSSKAAKINIFPALTPSPHPSPDTLSSPGKSSSDPLLALVHQLNKQQEKLESLLTQKKEIEKSLNDLKMQINSNNAVYMSTNFGDLVEKRENLRHKLDDVSYKIRNVKSKITELKTQIKEMKKNLGSSEKRIILEEPESTNLLPPLH